MASQKLNAPVVGIASDGAGGYWLVGSDGGIFSFDGAGYYGSMGAKPLNQPVVGISATPTRTRLLGGSPPTAGSSPSGMPASTAPWGASP